MPHLNLLDVILLLDASSAGALSRLFFLESKLFGILAIGRSSVIGFFKDRIGLDGLKLGLEARKTSSTEGAAVGAATGVGKVVSVVLGFVAGLAPRRRVSICTGDETDGGTVPVALTAAFFLGLLGIGVDVSRLGKVARKVLLWGSGAVGKASVVTVVVFLGASH